MKKVQVLLSTYNGEKYIKEQIKSIFNQIGVDVFCLVRDDGSQDNTLKILYELKKIYKNLEVISQKNIGWRKSFKKLVYLSNDNMDYYSFSDQDDVWLPNKLKRGIEVLEKENNNIPLLYYSNAYIVDNDLNIIGEKKNIKPPVIKENFISACYGQGCTMIFNLKANQYFKLYETKNDISHEHWLSCLCAYFGKIIYDPFYSIFYRQHEHNVFGSKKNNKFYLLKEWILKKKNYKDSLCYQELYDGYFEYLEIKDKKILLDFIKSEKSMMARIKLILNPNIKRYSKLGTLFFKLNLLLDKNWR